MRRRRATGKLGGSFEELALQSHQISGIADPYTPTRLLMRMDARDAGTGRPKARNVRDPELARLVNEGLAPAA